MGKKKNNENIQQPQTQKQHEEEQQTEGKFLLGKPKFKKLENGRYKCVQTGHELLADARESYALTKHCRLGLIDYALARNKPPLNMFNQDPLCRSKLICKLTEDTVNKTEEHIWKHINGKRFLNMLEKEEAEAGKESSNGLVEEGGVEPKPEKAAQSKEEGSKKKKKNKKKKEKEIDVSKVESEVRNPEEQDSDAEEEEFWMPPVGDRWDFDDGKDRWGSDLESDMDPENDDADETDAAGAGEEESNEAQELSNRTKRMSIEIEPKKEEAEAGKESSNGLVEEGGVEPKPEKAAQSKEEGSKKKKKNKKKKEKESDVSKVESEVRNPEEQVSDAEEEEFWMPPVGDRWDFDDGKDRWGSDLESDMDPENDDADETDAAGAGEEESNEAQELSNRTKRMSIEIEPSELASKKKKKTQST